VDHGAILRTDERRALALLAEGRWLGARDGDGRRRAWVQLSQHAGDDVPVGWDVFARLRDAGYLAPGASLPRGGRRFHLTPAGRRAVGAPGA
jgi:hypothetical protein